MNVDIQPRLLSNVNRIRLKISNEKLKTEATDFVEQFSHLILSLSLSDGGNGASAGADTGKKVGRHGATYSAKALFYCFITC